MKKAFFISVSCFILLLSFSCNAKKAETATNANAKNSAALDLEATKTLLTDYLNATNELDNAVKPDADPKVVGQALLDYTTKMKGYSPLLKDLTGNHPDFINNPPEDMKQLVTDYQATAETLKRIFTNLVPFMQDPTVAAAIQNL